MSKIVSYWDAWEPTGTYFAGEPERGKWVHITEEEKERRLDVHEKWAKKIDKLQAKIDKLYRKGPKR